jgi:uncharacterized protein YcnI
MLSPGRAASAPALRLSSLFILPMLALPLLPATVSAHVTIEIREAPVGAPYKGVFRVPHGCGSSSTVKLRVRIPDGVIAVKPMPKPGWTLETVKGKYGKPYAYFHDVTLTEGVREASWTGKLADEHYDEFVLSMFLAADLPAGTTLYFPVVQECESGIHRWIEIPAEGKTPADYKEPAPGVRLLPKR